MKRSAAYQYVDRLCTHLYDSKSWSAATPLTKERSLPPSPRRNRDDHKIRAEMYFSTDYQLIVDLRTGPRPMVVLRRSEVMRWLAALLSIGSLALGCALLVTNTHRTYVVDPGPQLGVDESGRGISIPGSPYPIAIECGNALHSGPEMVYPRPDTWIDWPCKQTLSTRRLQAAVPLAGGLLLGILTVVATRRAARPDEEGDDLDEAAVTASTP